MLEPREATGKSMAVDDKWAAPSYDREAFRLPAIRAISEQGPGVTVRRF